MRFGYFKNIFADKHEKFRILDGIKRGEIDIKNIKYLTLEGYSSSYNHSYPNEEYLYISNFGYPKSNHICFNYGCHENYIKDVLIEVRNIGYWESGVLSSVKLTVKNNKILIESEMKPD